ncbi:integrase, catalytic region, zinc finger, CCHC-type containing protein [Tanacetum coccineum]
MDDMIKEKLALKELVDSLEQNLSKQIKEKECLLHTFTNFKNESKEKEDKYMENEIELEKKIKEFDNILFKVGQSAQTMLMLTKPQAFYDNIHKQAPGYQNLFHLKKAQRIKPTLYDGIVMSNKHLNILTENFGKRFTPQQELSAEQAFWLRMSDPTSKPSAALPVKIEAPKELPKISLYSVDKQCLEIAKKELLLENDRLLQQIMSQNILLTVMNSMSLIGETVNMDGNRKESCSSKKAKIVESKNANHSEPNHTWGSNAIDIPSSSFLVMTGCPDCSLVSGLRCFVSKTMTGNRSQLTNFVSKFMGTVRFRNDHVARIMGYGDYQLGNVTISRVLLQASLKDGLALDKKPDLSFLHVFGSLCYPTNDHEDLGKFDANPDIGIFVGYTPTKKAFRIYNRRTRIISEIIHVTFDELTAMVSEQFSSEPRLQYMTPATSCT